MSRWAARARAERERRLAGQAGEAGFTLVELMVAMLVLVICLAITAEVVVAITHQSTVGLAQGQAADTSQVSLDGVAQYIEGAVTPMQAYQAQGNAPGTDPPGLTSYCWGGSYPGVSPQSQLIGTDTTGTVTVASGVYGSTTPTVVDPSSLSVIYAHDYDLELCAYAPGSSTPHVYELYMPYDSCKSTTGSNPVGDCTLYVAEDVGSYSTNADYASHGQHPASMKVVDQVNNVWCDQGCLDALPCNATCPATRTSGSCWSQLAASQALSSSGFTVPAPCAGITAADESSYTPPLFTYSGGTSAQSTANVAATNLDLTCSGGSGSTCTPSTFTASGNPVCQATSSPPAYVTSSDDAVCLTRFSFGAIELRMTVLGDTNQANSVTSSTAVTPKVSVSRTISLTNLTSEAQP